MAVSTNAPSNSGPAATAVPASSNGSGPLAPDQSQNGGVSSPASVETSSGAEPKVDYFRSMFHNMRGLPVEERVVEATPDGAEREPEGASAAGSAKVPTSAETKGADGEAGTTEQNSKNRPLVFDTQEALDRHIQSEVDRRAAETARKERIRLEKERERELLETDPYKYAQLVKTREAREQEDAALTGRIVSFAKEQVDLYDDLVLTPMFRRLPAQDREAILSGIEEGLPGRGKAADAALSALERHYTQKGIESARTALLNDQSFVKEILTRYGGQNYEVEPVPSAGASSQPANMNDVLFNMARPILQRRRG